MPSKVSITDPYDEFSHEFEVPAYFCVEFDSGQNNFEASECMKILALQAEIDYHHAEQLAFDFILECQWDSRLMIVIHIDESDFEEIDEEGDWTVDVVCEEFNSNQPSFECHDMMIYLMRDALRHLNAWVSCAKRCRDNEEDFYWRIDRRTDFYYIDRYMELNYILYQYPDPD